MSQEFPKEQTPGFPTQFSEQLGSYILLSI